MGKKPTEPDVLALGGYHGKTSKVGTAGLGEGSLLSVVVYLVILAVNESVSIKAEEVPPPPPQRPTPLVRITQAGCRTRQDTVGTIYPL